jgi:RNA polymerase sigma factor (TIGR02999 family)
MGVPRCCPTKEILLGHLTVLYRCAVYSLAMNNVTRDLSKTDSGDPSASEELLPLVYDELRKLASARLAGERPGQTLQATALVHEAYLRLVGSGEAPSWQSRGHFFAAAAEAMRRILIDAARRKGRVKRGGDLQRCDFEVADIAIEVPSEDILAVDQALTALAKEQPVKAELVKLRYFGGLTLAEAASALQISTATADRYWRYARAWLAQQIREGD